MKKTILCAGVFCAALTLTGCRGGSLVGNIFSCYKYSHADEYLIGDFEYDKSQVKKVEIDWISGKINLSQSDNEILSVSEIDKTLNDAQKMHYRIADEMLSIKFCKSGYIGEFLGKQKEINVELPKNVEIKICTVSSDIYSSATSFTNNFVVNTVSGNLNFEAIETSGEVKINTTSGNVDVKNIKAEKMTFDSVSGELDIPNIDVNSIVKTNTTSGNVKLGVNSTKSIDIDTVSGKTMIYLKEDLGMTVKFDSVSGDLTTDLPHTINKKTITIDDGTIDAKVNSTSGDLYINRK